MKRTKAEEPHRHGWSKNGANNDNIKACNIKLHHEERSKKDSENTAAKSNNDNIKARDVKLHHAERSKKNSENTVAK